MESLSIRQEGDRVLLIKDGRLICDMPWHAALQVADYIKSKAKLAEEYAHKEKIIDDQALLIRAGMPFGLTNHPVMLKEAVKEAFTNRFLRRALPFGVKSTSVVGTPTVKLGKPKNGGS